MPFDHQGGGGYFLCIQHIGPVLLTHPAIIPHIFLLLSSPSKRTALTLEGGVAASRLWVNNSLDRAEI